MQVYGSCLVGTDVIGSDLDLSLNASLTMCPLDRSTGTRSGSDHTMRLVRPPLRPFLPECSHNVAFWNRPLRSSALLLAEGVQSAFDRSCA